MTKTSGRDLYTGVKQDRTAHLSLAGRIRTGAGQNVARCGRALVTSCLGLARTHYLLCKHPPHPVPQCSHHCYRAVMAVTSQGGCKGRVSSCMQSAYSRAWPRVSLH